MRFLSLFSGIEAASVALLPLGAACVAVAEIEKFPCSVLNHHYPDVPNLGDVTKITQEQIKALGHIDVVIGGFPCFTVGHTVLTQRGLIAIEDVVEGDSVWTHKSRWRRVINTMVRTAPTVIMSGQGHSAMRSTPDHLFFASETIKTWNGNGRTRLLAEPDWVRAENMSGKRWATPTSIKSHIAIPKEFRSLDAAYLAGLYLGDGHIAKTAGKNKKAIILSVGATKRENILPKLREAWGIVSDTKHGDSVFRLQLSRTYMADAMLEHFGEYSHAKSIPLWAIASDKKWQEAFLQGILDTDGSKIQNGYRITTVSRAMAIGLRLIAARLNYSTSLSFMKRPPICVIEGRTVNQRDTWTVIFRRGNRTSELRDENHAWGLVRNVSPAEDATVYDITVEEDHSFVCDGIVVHNCQDLSIAGKRKGLKNEDGSNTRSGLFYDAMRIVRWSGARFLWLENVPGIYSSNKGRDFAAVVGEILGCEFDVPKNGWENSGAAASEIGLLEWATLDAQYANLAQRRCRMFAIADFGDWANRAPILLESAGLSGHPPSRKESGQSIAHDVAPCLTSSGRGVERGGDTRGQDPVVAVDLSGTIDAASGRSRGAGTSPGMCIPTVSRCLVAGGQQRNDAESETLIPIFGGHFSSIESAIAIQDVSGRDKAQNGKGWGDDGTSYTLDAAATQGVAYVHSVALRGRDGGATAELGDEVAGCLRATTGGSDKAHVLAPIAFQPGNLIRSCGSTPNAEVFPTLAANHGRGLSDQDLHVAYPIAFSCKDYGGDASIDLSPTLRSGNADTSHANGGQPPAIAFYSRQDCVSSTEVFGSLGSSSPQARAIATQYAVRRLTPVECARLQGFPDDYLGSIIHRGKAPADGPMYKALGNSMAVPVIAYIGKRLMECMP